MMGTWLVEWSGAYVQPTKLDAFPFFFSFSFPRNFCAEDYHVLCHTIGFLLCFFFVAHPFIVSICTMDGWGRLAPRRPLCI